jgi:hypothetical protein
MPVPAQDEAQINIFGPGFGECILIHAGFNEWIVIDSCVDSESGRPAALVYLESLGIDPETAVKFVLCTHWHDDHIGGIAELLLACKNAEFACSSALTQIEFLEAVQIFNKRPLIIDSSGLSEIQKVFVILRSRKPPKFAIADLPLLRLGTASSVPRCELTALSPTQVEFQRFLQSISQLIPRIGMTKFRCPSLNPNDLSVAAWLRIGSLQVLLGADLEEHGVSGRGWTAVLASSTKPPGRAGVFKVAHHGSLTGHHPNVWTDMLDGGAIAVVTPWGLGRSKLPRRRDCDRILALTSSAYASSRPTPRRVRGLPAPVTRTLREAGVTIRGAEPPTGCVRLQAQISNPASTWAVSLSPGAMSLQDYVSGH